MAKAIKSNETGLWLQREGANTDLVFLGCHDLGDITEPKKALTPIRCRTRDGKKWITVAQLEAPPGNPTTNIKTLIMPQRDYIEKINCPANLLFLEYDCGPRDQINSYARGEVLHNIRPTQRVISGNTTSEEEVKHEVALDLEMDELLDVDDLWRARIALAQNFAINDIWVDINASCVSSCSGAVDAGDIQLLTCDSDVAPAKAKTYISVNAGETWTVLAADPGVQGKNLMGVTMFQMTKTTNRIIVFQEALGADQGVLYYSDDAGATWTTVNVGGAAAGHGIVKATALYMPRGDFGLIAVKAGYIYKTIDNGETWVAKEAGSIHVGDWNCIDFADDYYGIVGGAADVIAMTADGGESWQVATATGSGSAINACQRLDKYRAWVGTANGKLYYTTNGGLTWTQRTGFVGSGIGAVRDIQFINEMIGFLLMNTAAPVGNTLRTIDGGVHWKTFNAVTNSGLNRLGAVAQDFVMSVGEANGGTGVIIKGEAANAP